MVAGEEDRRVTRGERSSREAGSRQMAAKTTTKATTKATKKATTKSSTKATTKAAKASARTTTRASGKPMRVFEQDEAGFDESWFSICNRRVDSVLDVERDVAKIIKDVRSGGDEALLACVE